MIPKIIPRYSKNKTNPKKLVDYVAFREDDATHIPSQTVQAQDSRLIDYVSRGAEENNVIATFEDGSTRINYQGTITQFNTFSLATAGDEMRSLAQKNPRCIDPMYHFVLSWKEHESPSNDVVIACARQCIDSLGMRSHQHVISIHTDTDNLHCHVVVNKVNPHSLRVATLYNDAEILHRECRYLELEYGFEQDNGCYKINENGWVVRDRTKKPSIPDGALKQEIHSGKESFYHYVKRNVFDNVDWIIKNQQPTARWNFIHHELNQCSLKLVKTERGFLIKELDETSHYAIKATSLHPLLTEAYLGDFTRPDFLLSPRKKYDSIRYLRDKTIRDDKRLARAKARLDLRTRYQNYKNDWVSPYPSKEDVQKRFLAIRHKYNYEKSYTRYFVKSALVRKLQYHVIELEKQKELSALRLELKAHRNAISGDINSKRLSYKEWVYQQATEHQDMAALSQLRGWAYKEKRISKDASPHIIHCDNLDYQPSFNSPRYDVTVRSNGDVAYTHKEDGKLAIIDKGNRIEVFDWKDKEFQPLLDSLTLAYRRDQSKIKLESPDKDFERYAAMIVEQFKLDNQPKRLNTLNKVEESAQNSKSNTYQLRPH